MSINYDYCEIDIADIWDYERDLYLNREINQDKAASLLDKIQLTIISLGTFLYDHSLYDNGSESEKKYYERNVKEYLTSDLEQKFRMEFFFHQDKCYQYCQELIIKRNHPDFEYFFILKLGQYQHKLSYVNVFLNYQLKKSYNKAKEIFLEFLNIVQDQYENLYTNALIHQIHKFINKNLVNEDKSESKITKPRNGVKYTSKLLALHLYYLISTGKKEDPNKGDKQSKLKTYLKEMQSSLSWKNLSLAYDSVTSTRERHKILHTCPNNRLAQDYKELLLDMPNTANDMITKIQEDYMEQSE